MHRVRQYLAVSAFSALVLAACGGGGGEGGTSGSASSSGSAASASSARSSAANSAASSATFSSGASVSASSVAASSVTSSAGSVSSSSSSAASVSSSTATSSVASSKASSTASSVASSVASSAASSSSIPSIVVYKGVSLAVAEFGVNDTWGNGTLPGTYGSTYTYPTTQEVDYFVAKGMNTLRLPFRWERLQRTLGGAFDTAELGYINSFVSYATSKGAYVVLDPHNYARYYTNVIGSSSVTQAHFVDFWSRLATQYKGNSKVIFALMNEPHDMDSDVWLNAANAAIAGIRTAGATNLILVPGIAYTGAHTWVSSGNSTKMLSIVDSGNNYAFEVHQYLDGDSSGTSSTCTSTTAGSERLAGFTAWLKTNNKRGFLGEFAGANNGTCQMAITDQLNHVKNNANVWLGWTWWAAGPWWGDYMFTLEPTNSFTTDRPQMSWLTPFL